MLSHQVTDCEIDIHGTITSTKSRLLLGSTQHLFHEALWELPSLGMC